jgi:transcriptional regulator with PAS, ATPase and Fis domain
MENILICWLGKTDLRAVTESDQVGLGPIAQAVTSRPFNKVVLINDYPELEGITYIQWLKTLTSADVILEQEKLSGPTKFGEIYEAAVRVITEILRKQKREANLTFHLSPGTPAMATVWIILAKTRFPAELIESSQEHGVSTASVPFDISAEFIQDLLRKPGQELQRLSFGLSPEAPEFSDIFYRSRVMQRVILQARRIAPHSIPVLIEGESGTGKEMLARAIHRASPRRDRPFIAINCGAIPSELIEAELFGHAKGAFTGATSSRKGYFEAADSGVLFLDEIGEMPKSTQVKLLRILQEGEVFRVGATKPVKINVRTIAATNRNLIGEVSCGNFREDIFYRLAVAVIKVPPLRERTGDIGILIDKLMPKINAETLAQTGANHKNISINARNLILQYSWPGNVRELINTLTRAVVWSSGDTIDEEDIKDALLPLPAVPPQENGILRRPLENGVDLPELIREVAVHYLNRGLEKTHGNKSKAAELLGLPSYQTLTNWLKKYGVE